jgi:hypothetical protein
LEGGRSGKLIEAQHAQTLSFFVSVCSVIGLSDNEILDGDIDMIFLRFNGWAMLRKANEIQEWKRARMIAFTVARSLGATKAKKENDFLRIDEPARKMPSTKLTQEQIERLKNL